MTPCKEIVCLILCCFGTCQGVRPGVSVHLFLADSRIVLLESAALQVSRRICEVVRQQPTWIR